MEGGLFCAGGRVEGFGYGDGERVSLIFGFLFYPRTETNGICLLGSSLVYVEGDCSMNKFTNKEGTAQTALSIVQREYLSWRCGYGC